jgi:two-component system sensor histidine kinase KdpD
VATEQVHRKTPEEYLGDLQAEEAAGGHLKIFLGYTSGVGKTFRMLDEARRRRERGQDVVVGAVQPQVPAEAQQLLQHLEVIPLKPIGEGTAIDVDALIRRRPAVCIIDGLAYDNPPCARNPTRWQDVQDLIRAGIRVIGSINVQYVAELRNQVEAITGKPVVSTVPLAFLKSADEIEIIDAPPEEPMERSPEQIHEATRREQQLSRLREIALVLAADVVDQQLTDYLERHGINQQLGAQERVMVCLTPRANAKEMLESARLFTERFHGELVAAYVHQPELSAADRTALEEKLTAARDAGAQIEILEGDDPVETLLSFARARGITQLFIGHSQRSGIRFRVTGNPVDRLISNSQGMDIRVFPQ